MGMTEEEEEDDILPPLPDIPALPTQRFRARRKIHDGEEAGEVHAGLAEDTEEDGEVDDGQGAMGGP